MCACVCVYLILWQDTIQLLYCFPTQVLEYINNKKKKSRIKFN